MIRCQTCTREAPEWAVEHFTGSCPWCLASVRPLKRYREVMVEPAIVPPSVKVKGVPAELDSIILKCLSHNPGDRYASVAEMVKDLQNWKKGEAVEAHSRGIGYRAWKFVARRRMKVAAVLLAVTASVGLWRLEASRLDAVAVRESAIWTRVGEERLDRGDDRGARDAFTRVIEIRPTAKAYLDRTFAHWRLRDYRACLADVSLALALDPANPAAERTMATVTAFAHIP
jgi:hypothetical protein